VLLIMMIPQTVTLIPLYQEMMWFGWIDTYQAVIVTNLITAFGTFMLRQFCSSIPDELLDAARIDGASEVRIFHRIVLPMFKNPLSALAVLQFLWTWDSYLWPLIVLTDKNKYTVTLGLGALNGQYGTPVEKMMAGACIAVLPVVVAYVIFQRKIIEGMAGAVKG
jgi:ABC-type glycerol-3-phosphate transport system permease component